MIIKNITYIMTLAILQLFCECASDSSHSRTQTEELQDSISKLPDFSQLENWTAGDIVDADLVHAYGVDKCFCSDSISDSLFNLMKGTTYHADTPIPRTDLCYLKLLHYDSKDKIHLGEMICNRGIASDLLEIFRELFNERYPIERMMLMSKYGGDDEKSITSCFNSRKMTGSHKPSRHAFGMAVDINPLYNPYVKKLNDGTVKILPENACYPECESSYQIKKGDLCYRLFISHGFNWGGAWRTVKDYQHFEKRP